VNPLNPNLSRALSAFDVTHNFVATYRYELPTRFLHGWELSGLTRFSTGFPVTLYNNNDTSLLGTIPNGVNNNGVDTPNYAPGALDIIAALLGGDATLAEEIAVAEKLAFAVVRHFGLVKSKNAGDAHHDGIHLQAGPVIRPLLDIEHGGIVFGHIGLAEPADFPLPGHGRVGGK
ncbi:MAG: hypothetical protein ACLPX8_21190, partial [Bryobacteraceae bacterium]